MAGLCGWFQHQHPYDNHASLIERMSAELNHFDASTVASTSTPQLGLAASSLGSIARACINKNLGLALHGRVRDQNGAMLDAISAESAIIQAYKDGGIDAVFAGFGGPFSFILIDIERQVAYGATDRLGICPLTFTESADGGVVFGSSGHCLAAHPEVHPSLDPQCLYQYLFFHVVPSPGKAYRNQRALEPGEYVRADAAGVSVGRYWQMHYEDTMEGFSLDTAKKDAHQLTAQAVERLATGEKVGAFLSGGVDSSTVAGKLRDVRGDSHTYSIGFEAEDFDEMEFARQSANHFGTQHNEYYVTPSDIVELAPQVAAIYDAPFGNASAIGAYFCARRAREDGADLILGGDGGDELFAGNERYLSQHVFERYQNLPLGLRSGLIEPLLNMIPMGNRLPVIKKALSYVGQANMPMPDRLQSYNLLLRLGAGNVLTENFLDGIDPDAPFAGLRHWYNDSSDADSMLHHMLALDLKLTLADNDLPKVSRMCELAGIEVAFPMLDEDLLAFSGRIPSDINLKDKKLRWFFKEAMRGYLPDETITKKKQGFGLPFGVWCTTSEDLKALAGDNLADLKKRGIIRPAFIDQLWDKWLWEHPTYYGTLIWLLLMMELWLKHHEAEYRV